MTRVARVSQIDYERGMVKVAMLEREGTVSNWIPYQSFEYDMPKVGELVTTEFYDGNWTEGICFGKHYNKTNMPALSGPTVYYKKCGDDVVVIYGKDTKELQIVAEKIILMGDVEITGDLKVAKDINVGGNVNVTGIVTAAAFILGGGGG